MLSIVLSSVCICKVSKLNFKGIRMFFCFVLNLFFAALEMCLLSNFHLNTFPHFEPVFFFLPYIVIGLFCSFCLLRL